MMNLKIEGKEYIYSPDYSPSSKNWHTQAQGAAFAFPVEIGGRLFFIKRFQNIPSGWLTLKLLEGRISKNLPRVFQVVENVEKNKKIFYAFYEYIEGDTLNNLLNQGQISFEYKKIFLDLTQAIYEITHNKVWFADFCEKNIYYSYNLRHCLLIDIDSTWPVDKRPNTDENQPGGIISHNYMSPIIKYIKNYLGEHNFDISQLRGDQVNWLQLIFFSLKLRYYSEQKRHDPSYAYIRPVKSTEITEDLAKLLHEFTKNYRLTENCNRLFIKAKNSLLTYEDIIEFGDKIFDLQPQILRFAPEHKARIRIGETARLNFLAQGQSEVKIEPKPLATRFESFDVMPQESTVYTLTVKDVFGQEATALKQIQVRPKSTFAPMLSSVRSWTVAAAIVVSGVGVYWRYNGARAQVETTTATETEVPAPTPKPQELPPVPSPSPTPTLSAEDQFTEYYMQAINKYREGKTPEAIELLEKALIIKSDHRADTLLKELKSYDNE